MPWLTSWASPISWGPSKFGGSNIVVAPKGLMSYQEKVGTFLKEGPSLYLNPVPLFSFPLVTTLVPGSPSHSCIFTYCLAKIHLCLLWTRLLAGCCWHKDFKDPVPVPWAQGPWEEQQVNIILEWWTGLAQEGGDQQSLLWTPTRLRAREIPFLIPAPQIHVEKIT